MKRPNQVWGIKDEYFEKVYPEQVKKWKKKPEKKETAKPCQLDLFKKF